MPLFLLQGASLKSTGLRRPNASLLPSWGILSILPVRFYGVLKGQVAHAHCLPVPAGSTLRQGERRDH